MRILISEDKDFGEWIFSYHYTDETVILLRYDFKNLDMIINSLMQVLKKNIYLENKFIVITEHKTRVREI